MSRCSAELCKYWTGSGCACEVFDLEPEAEEDGFCLKCETFCHGLCEDEPCDYCLEYECDCEYRN